MNLCRLQRQFLSGIMCPLWVPATVHWPSAFCPGSSICLWSCLWCPRLCSFFHLPAFMNIFLYETEKTPRLCYLDVPKLPTPKSPPSLLQSLLGKDGRREEKGITEDEMVGWHHWCDGHEFEQAPGVGDGQGGLLCCSPWGHRSPTWWTWLWVSSGSGWWTGRPGVLWSMGSQRVRLDGLDFEQAPGVGDGQGGLACCGPWGRRETRMSDWAELNCHHLGCLHLKHLWSNIPLSGHGRFYSSSPCRPANVLHLQPSSLFILSSTSSSHLLFLKVPGPRLQFLWPTVLHTSS